MAIPVNSVLPVITGTVIVGQTLIVDDGTWSGTPTYTYSWLRDGVAISGATTNAHILIADDIGSVIKARVTATNIDGTAFADSLGTITVPSTLIVESWPLVSNADCYVSLAYANTYWSNRNDSTWAAATSGAKESALRQATQYLDDNYEWSGERNTTTQSLAWPRVLEYGLDSDRRSVISTEIPKAIKDATCELAKAALSGSLAANASRGGMIKEETVGPLSVTYMDGASSATKYQLVDLLVRRLVSGGAGLSLSSTVNRA